MVELSRDGRLLVRNLCRLAHSLYPEHEATMTEREKTERVRALQLAASVAPMLAGYLAGDRDAVLLEWMEGRDWERFYAAIAALAEHDSPINPQEPLYPKDGLGL